MKQAKSVSCSECLPLVTAINIINPLKAELNPICDLMALSGSHHIIQLSRVRVNFVEFFNSSTVNFMLLGLGLGLCLSNSYAIFLLIPLFRYLNIKIFFYIFFPSDSSPKFSKKCLTIPHSFPFPPSIQSP